MKQILHSNVLGSGKPLIILHGFLGMSDNWKTLGSQYAANGFEVHMVDQRNHGKSFWSEAFDYQIMSDDLHDYLNEKGIKSASILGHSMGGKTAMRFASMHPEKTTSLIVADIAPKFYPPHHQDIINALTSLDLKSYSSRSEADKALALDIGDFGIRQFLLKNLYWIEKGKLGFRFNLDVLKNRMEEIGENLNGSASYPGKVLFLRGDRSEYIQNTDFPIIKNYFPNAELSTIQNAGHWLHAENPKQFFESTLLFLNR